MITKGEWHQGENWRYIYDNKGIIIAIVDDIAIRDIRENLANARLIAAAPLLYEACVRARLFLGLLVVSPKHNKAWDILIVELDKVLAKVEDKK